MTRRVTRAVYHNSFNTKTNVSIASLFNLHIDNCIMNFTSNVYVGVLQYFDIAVLTVDPPIVYSKAISPVCLPAANTAVDLFLGLDAATMGWGTLSLGKKIISWFSKYIMKRD